MVAVFLRGGADGLSLVAPLGDDDYHRHRPTLALTDAIDVDGFFAFHPALAPWVRRFRDGELAVVHAVGSDDQTRSHFEAQDRMEHAGPPGRPFGSGWMARLVRQVADREGRRGLGAVAVGTAVPESLRGASQVAVFETAREHRLGADADYLRSLASLYRSPDALGAAGRDALATLSRLRDLPSPVRPADYPDGRFGARLAELAQLVRAGVGVRAASVDLGGWDTHFVQADGFHDRARELAQGLDAFIEDLDTEARRVTVLVMTEFGRRVYENGSLGTDHGRGSVLFALGSQVRGGRVLGRWPGLGRTELEPPGDLAVTTDYRQVLAELVERLYAGLDRERVVPAVSPDRLGVFEPPDS